MTSRFLVAGVVVAAVVACGGEQDTNIPSPFDGGVTNDAALPDTSAERDTGGPVSDDASSQTDAPTGADSSVVDAAPPAFNPGSLQSLVLWLDSAKGVTQVNGKVSKWLDQSPNHNDANQGTANRQPTLTPAVVNGLPALRFSNANNGFNQVVVADAPTLQWSTGDFYVVTVARFDNQSQGGTNTGVGTLYSKAGYVNFQTYTGLAFTGNVPGNNQSATVGLAGFLRSVNTTSPVSSGNAYNTNVAHVFAMERVGNSLNLRVDGLQVGQASASNLNADFQGYSVRIGCEGDNFNFYRLNGDVAETLAVKGVLAVADRASVEGYLKGKYATP